MINPDIKRLLTGGQRTFRRHLAAEQVDSGRRLTRAYRDEVKPKIDQRLRDLRVLAQEDGMTGKALANEPAVVRLKDAVRDALDGMSATIEAEARQLQTEGVRAGLATAMTLLEMTLDDVNRPTVGQLVGDTNYVESSPFQQILKSFGAYHADRVGDLVYQGAAMGKHPETLARFVTNYLKDLPLVDAVRTTRTVAIWSARQSQHAAFRSNSDVVTGWIWVSALTPRTCAGCWAMHGSFHGLDEELNDHHAGLCAPVPVTKSWADFGFGDGEEVTAGIQSGEELFAALPADEQKQILGKSKLTAYNDGLFNFDQLSTTYQDVVYGTMRKEASLDSLIGEQAAALYKRPAA